MLGRVAGTDNRELFARFWHSSFSEAMRVKVDICRITYGFLNMEPLDAVGDVKAVAR